MKHFSGNSIDTLDKVDSSSRSLDTIINKKTEKHVKNTTDSKTSTKNRSPPQKQKVNIVNSLSKVNSHKGSSKRNRKRAKHSNTGKSRFNKNHNQNNQKNSRTSERSTKNLFSISEDVTDSSIVNKSCLQGCTDINVSNKTCGKDKTVTTTKHFDKPTKELFYKDTRNAKIDSEIRTSNNLERNGINYNDCSSGKTHYFKSAERQGENLIDNISKDDCLKSDPTLCNLIKSNKIDTDCEQSQKLIENHNIIDSKTSKKNISLVQRQQENLIDNVSRDDCLKSALVVHNPIENKKVNRDCNWLQKLIENNNITDTKTTEEIISVVQRQPENVIDNISRDDCLNSTLMLCNPIESNKSNINCNRSQKLIENYIIDPKTSKENISFVQRQREDVIDNVLRVAVHKHSSEIKRNRREYYSDKLKFNKESYSRNQKHLETLECDVKDSNKFQSFADSSLVTTSHFESKVFEEICIENKINRSNLKTRTSSNVNNCSKYDADSLGKKYNLKPTPFKFDKQIQSKCITCHNKELQNLIGCNTNIVDSKSQMKETSSAQRYEVKMTNDTPGFDIYKYSSKENIYLDKESQLNKTNHNKPTYQLFEKNSHENAEKRRKKEDFKRIFNNVLYPRRLRKVNTSKYHKTYLTPSMGNRSLNNNQIIWANNRTYKEFIEASCLGSNEIWKCIRKVAEKDIKNDITKYPIPSKNNKATVFNEWFLCHVKYFLFIILLYIGYNFYNY